MRQKKHEAESKISRKHKLKDKILSYIHLVLCLGANMYIA